MSVFFILFSILLAIPQQSLAAPADATTNEQEWWQLPTVIRTESIEGKNVDIRYFPEVIPPKIDGTELVTQIKSRITSPNMLNILQGLLNEEINKKTHWAECGPRLINRGANVNVISSCVIASGAVRGELWNCGSVFGRRIWKTRIARETVTWSVSLKPRLSKGQLAFDHDENFDFGNSVVGALDKLIGNPIKSTIQGKLRKIVEKVVDDFSQSLQIRGAKLVIRDFRFDKGENEELELFFEAQIRFTQEQLNQLFEKIFTQAQFNQRFLEMLHNAISKK